MVRIMMVVVMTAVMITTMTRILRTINLTMPYVANELLRSPRKATKAPPTAVFLQPK